MANEEKNINNDIGKMPQLLIGLLRSNTMIEGKMLIRLFFPVCVFRLQSTDCDWLSSPKKE